MGTSNNGEAKLKTPHIQKTRGWLISLLLLSFFTVTAFGAIDDGLVASYPFNGNVNDEAVSGVNGKVFGATLTADRSGASNTAYSFDGTGQHILVGDPVPAKLAIQNEFTLEAWIYASEYPANNKNNENVALIVGSQYDATQSGASIFLDGRTNPDSQVAPAGHIHFQIGDGSWHTTNANSQVPLNQWVHIVATRKANEAGKIYYNGVLQPSTSVAWSGAVSYTSAWFAIGQQKDLNRSFNGKIDDVRLYNRALSSTEVQQRYNASVLQSCIAMYSPTGQLHIPYVSVPDTAGTTTMYEADMQLLPLSNPMKFELTGAKTISTSPTCSATYSLTGRLHIPSVSVPDAVGAKTLYEADMQLLPLSNPMRFELTDAKIKTLAPPIPAISTGYIQGDMAGNPAFSIEVSASVAKTSAALLQSILTVNSLLFTDFSSATIETVKSRTLKADKALAVLVKYAAETETLIAANMPKKQVALSPEDVLATVASGPSNQQIKTLMNTYGVNAKRAQLILNTAMAGLESGAWSDLATAENKVVQTLNLIKEGSALSFTIAGTVLTAGGVSGALAAGDAAIAIIGGVDGVIKVSKAGLELAVGRDVTFPDGSGTSMVITSIASVNDIIAFKDLGKLVSQGLKTAENVGNIYTISSKIADGFVDKTITLSGVKVDISNGLSIGSSFDVGYINSLIGGMINAPSTMPGTYKLNGVATVVNALPVAMSNAINVLPAADKVALENDGQELILTASQKADFLNCACRCSSGWAGNIGVWYEPNPTVTTENGGVGVCIGGAGSFGGTSRHPLIANECTKGCWPTSAGVYNASLIEQLFQKENAKFSK